jgi:UDP:flavonoid glycosyltransferase YjiC (YdhE family)
MNRKRVLYITGSIGLGHVTRDLAVARALRRLHPDIDLRWLGSETVQPLLMQAGEMLLPEASQLAEINLSAEEAAQPGFRLSLPRYLSHGRRGWEANAKLVEQIVENYDFDLVVGDEVYEVVLALLHGQMVMKPRFLSIYDFVGLEPMGYNPLERVACYLTVRKFVKRVPEEVITYGYVGDLEDVPDRPWGFLLPNRRQWARENCHFLGHIMTFDPSDVTDTSQLRKHLGYQNERLIVCSIGGTAVGVELLELCGRAFPLIRSRVPNLRMVLVCGPRLSPESLRIAEGPEIRGYVSELYKHFAVADLAIVQGGGTTTVELTALQKPFLYFPLEGHYEQQVYVAARLERHQAGVKMCFSDTTPESLAEAVLENIGRPVHYPPIPIDGARNAADLISKLLQET